MENIPVGIIGTGFIGPVHVEALRRTGLVTVKALADLDEKTALKKANDLRIPESYGDYRQLLEDSSIKSVHICAPNYLHYKIAKEALSAGKHVICEKPLAVNIKEAEEITALAKENKLANAVGFVLRYYPLIHEVKKLIVMGEIGEIFAVNGSYQQDWLFYKTDYNWRLEPEMGGESRAVADIGSHWLDMIEFVTGSKINKVCADFATFHKTRLKPANQIDTYTGKKPKLHDCFEVDIKTEDYATILLKFRNGAHGSLTVNQMAAGRKNRLFFEIYGSKKSVAWNSERPNELWIGNRDKTNEVMLKDPNLVDESVKEIISFPGGHIEGFPDTFKQMYIKFYCYIIEKGNENSIEPGFPTFADGLRELIICEKICESAIKEQWIDIV
jgi:Predicted dehydrogenases and related proteins